MDTSSQSPVIGRGDVEFSSNIHSHRCFGIQPSQNHVLIMPPLPFPSGRTHISAIFSLCQTQSALNFNSSSTASHLNSVYTASLPSLNLSRSTIQEWSHGRGMPRPVPSNGSCISVRSVCGAELKDKISNHYDELSRIGQEALCLLGGDWRKRVLDIDFGIGSLSQGCGEGRCLASSSSSLLRYLFFMFVVFCIFNLRQYHCP